MLGANLSSQNTRCRIRIVSYGFGPLQQQILNDSFAKTACHSPAALSIVKMTAVKITFAPGEPQSKHHQTDACLQEDCTGIVCNTPAPAADWFCRGDVINYPARLADGTGLPIGKVGLECWSSG